MTIAGNGRLSGKIALISGTAGGQGSAAALLFAREGATVVGADVNEDGNRKTMEEVTAAGYAMTALAPLNLSDPADARRWIRTAIDEHGRIDVLYNNASNARFAPFGDMTVEDYRFTVANELDLVWHCCQAVWPAMVAQGGGSIVNVGSIAGVVGIRGFPQAAHSATKAAVIGLGRQLAAEGAAHGIRVNTVTPGAIRNDSTAPILDMPNSPMANLVSGTVTRDAGACDDPVYAALFLASDEARYVTGQNIVVDGGASALI